MPLPATRPPTILDRAIEALTWVDRQSWSGLAAHGLSVVRALVGPPLTVELVTGKADVSDAVADALAYPSSQTAVRAGWTAALEFPYVAACVRAIAQDLAQLPLRVQDGRDKKARQVPAARVLDLLAQPNTQTTEMGLRETLVWYLLLCGVAYLEPVPLTGRPISVLAHHPDHVLPQRDLVGRVTHYMITGPNGQYSRKPEEIIRIAFPSIDPSGEEFSPVRSLIRELNLDWNLRDRAEKSAKKGGPDALLHPEGSDAAMDMMSGPELDEARRDLRVQMARHRGEPMLMGRRYGVTPLGYSQVDLATLEQREAVRDAVLASFGVPPVRVGLVTANYAQSKEMMLGYWGDTLPGYARRLDEAFTELSRRLREGPADRQVFHDFSGSPATQAGQSERLDRVERWVKLGVDPAAAAAYEGFEDAPFTATPAPDAEPTPADPAAAKAIEEWWTGRAEPTRTVPKADDEGGEWWAAWIRELHKPTETRIQRATLRVLREQRDAALTALDANVASYEALLPTGTPTKALSEDLVDLLVPIDDGSRLGTALRSLLRRALTDAHARTAGELDHSMTWDPVRLDPEVDGQLAELVRTHQATREAIRAQVREALLAGETVDQLRKRIQGCEAFTPARALRIARSETTRSLNAGNLAAYSQAVSEGVDAELVWISARDTEVRFAHAVLDGTAIAIGAVFTAPDGDTAPAPGQFRKAANNVNCRCGARARRKAKPS